MAALRVVVVSLAAALVVAGAPVVASGQSPPAPPPVGSSWYFAEGTTLPGWLEFLVVVNPRADRSIIVHADYQRERPAGVPQPPKSVDFSVSAGQRRTISVIDDALGAGAGFTGVATHLSSADGFVAERPVYMAHRFDVGEVDSAHDALGVPAPSTTWLFGEGSTLRSPVDGFAPFLALENPTITPAAVSIVYVTNNPDSTVTRTVGVPAQARFTIDVGSASDPSGVGPGFEGVAATVSADQPIVAERTMYVRHDFGLSQPVSGATTATGASAPRSKLYFAEGTVAADFDEFLTIYNPNQASLDLSIVYFVEGRKSTSTKRIVVNGAARTTVQVFNDADPGGLGRSYAEESAPGSAGVSVELETTNGVSFVAERPIYFVHDFGTGPIVGAHDSAGTGARASSWLFAEGTLRSGFTEYATVENTNPATVTVRLDYFLDDGSVVTATRSITPKTRATIVVGDPASQGSLGRPGPASVDFGLRATSVDAAGQPDDAAPIVVERPIYLAATVDGLAVHGGTDAIGLGLTATAAPPLP